MFIPLHDANRLRHIRFQYVTLAIIVANCVVFLMVGAASIDDDLVARAAFYSFGYVPAVANGTVTLPDSLHWVPDWTHYVTYAFLHGDFWHLAGNMLFLWVFADNVEDATGHLRFVLFFALCAAAGAYVHMLTAPDSEQPLIGASGAASGVVAAYLILHPRVKLWVLAFGRIPLRLRAYWVLGAWILFQFGSFLALADDEVSWAAHAGGIVTGAILIPFLKRRDVVLFDRNAEEAVPAAAPGATIAPSTPEPPETAATSAGGDPVLQPVPDSANRPPRVLWGRRDP